MRTYPEAKANFMWIPWCIETENEDSAIIVSHLGQVAGCFNATSSYEVYDLLVDAVGRHIWTVFGYVFGIQVNGIAYFELMFSCTEVYCGHADAKGLDC